MATQDELDLDDRELCPDGACIGVLDAHGVCKECGKRAERAGGPFRGEPVRTDVEADADAGTGTETGTGTEMGTAMDAATGDDAMAADDDDRELCVDGNCIGLIGKNGRCNECGKPRAG